MLVRLTSRMPPVRKLCGALLITGAALAISVGCAKRADHQPSQTAASEAAAPGAAPAEAPAAPPPPPPEQAPTTTPPTSLDEEKAGEKGGLTQPEPEPANIGEAEKLLAQSQKELEQLIGPLKADRAAGGAAPAPLATGDARCPRACKAFDSLKRAGDAICRLAGATDARCTKAKDVVKQNATRVAPCGCKDE